MQPYMMSHVDKLQASHLDIHDVNSPESQKALGVFLNLLSSCAGPSGKIHVVRNRCGGHVTFTSDCARLLAVLSVSRPELKLIVGSVQAHLQEHGDCGLFMACTCLQLVRSSKVQGVNFHVHTSLLNIFIRMMQDYLNSPDCPICVKADFSDLVVLLAYVRSIVKSKCLLNLTSVECNKMSELAVRTFAESIPTQQSSSDIHRSDGVYVIGVEKRCVKESKLEHGLLLEYLELPVFSGRIKLNVKTVPNQADKSCGEFATNNCVKVALFTCSLSGDMEEVIDATFEVTKEQSEDAEEEVIRRMLALCDSLDFHSVGLVLCQRVIHPRVKSTLKAKGVVFADRLGSQIIPYVQDLTCAKPIASIIATDFLSSMLGLVDTVSHVVEGDKGFLHLTNSQSSVVTLVLCAQWEERLAELKRCVKKALCGLQSLAREPRMLAGNGCWQTHCSFVLQNMVQKELSAIAEEANCTGAQVLSSLAIFRAVLHQWVKTLQDNTSDIVVDPSSFHCWRVPKDSGKLILETNASPVPCCCGLKSVPVIYLEDFTFVSSQETLFVNIPQTNCDIKAVAADVQINTTTILDNYQAATQALYRGVFTANLLLSVGQFITDRN